MKTFSKIAGMVKYRVTYPMITTNMAFRDYDSLEEALAFDTERLQMDERFLERYRSDISKARFSKVISTDLEVDEK